jgi:competence protein ComEC
LKRPSDIINSLFAAALIILIWEPQQLFQAGFQLSFVVVLCIILMVPLLHKLGERVMAPDPLLPAQLRRQWHPVVRVPARFAWDTLITSFAAWIGSLPLVAYYFHIVTPVSTPANLLAVPLCALVLMSNLGSLLLAAWFPGAAQIFNHAGWFLMECIRISSQWFATWPKAYFYFPMPSLFTGSLYYLLLFSFLTGWIFKAKLRVFKIALLALLVCAWSWQYWRECSTTRLTILPLNGGTAVYMDAPGIKNDLLIDCGASNSVRLVTKPFLRAQGVNRLPGLLLTHGDSRQVGGTEMMLDSFSVAQVCASPIRFRSPVYRQILEQLGRTPTRLRTISRNDRLGGWTLLHPSPDDHFPQADDNTVVLAGTFEHTRILLLSDLGRAGQNALLGRTPDLRADILVTGIPSGSEALGDAFLRVIQPRVIIVVDSEFPVGARASEKLRVRLAQQHVSVIYTRSAGAVTIELRHGRWELRTMSGIKIRSQHLGPSTNPLPRE